MQPEGLYDARNGIIITSAGFAGDADYNDVVDTARVAGHLVYLYHSHSVAHTLRGNVDHHESWVNFLAQKSGQKAEDLQDSGYVARAATLHTQPGESSALGVAWRSRHWKHCKPFTV